MALAPCCPVTSSSATGAECLCAASEAVCAMVMPGVAYCLLLLFVGCAHTQDTLVLSGVIATCLVFALIYIFSR